MGQQQLLLVILVTIIVGIATVVAINTFSSAADSANLDAVRQDLTSMAADAQGYYMKPNMMGGGGNEFTGITFDKINCPGDVGLSDGSGDNSQCQNENGIYTITNSTADVLEITAEPANDANPTVIISNSGGDSVDDFSISTS